MGWETAELGCSCPQEHSLTCSVLCSLQTGSGATGCVHQVKEAVKCQPAFCTKCWDWHCMKPFFSLPLGIRASCLINFGYNFYAAFTVLRKPIMSYLMEEIPVVFWQWRAVSLASLRPQLAARLDRSNLQPEALIFTAPKELQYLWTWWRANDAGSCVEERNYRKHDNSGGFWLRWKGWRINIPVMITCSVLGDDYYNQWKAVEYSLRTFNTFPFLDEISTV